jgi:cytochrome c oxidase cbb3-type subunit 3
MKCASLIFFLIAVSGELFLITARGGNPITASDRSAIALYSRNCASCHGRDGRAKTSRGRRNHSRDLNDHEWQERVSDERIFNSILNGKGKMPGYSKKFSEQEVDALVAYVRGLRR